MKLKNVVGCTDTDGYIISVCRVCEYKYGSECCNDFLDYYQRIIVIEIQCPKFRKFTNYYYAKSENRCEWCNNLIRENEIDDKEKIGCIDNSYHIKACKYCDFKNNDVQCQSYLNYAEAAIIHDDLHELETLLR